jgi:hypothetical protein
MVSSEHDAGAEPTMVAVRENLDTIERLLHFLESRT